MPQLRVLRLSALSLLVLVSICLPQADALGFRKKQTEPDPASQIQTHQPPPVDGLQTRCEPLRYKVVKINHGAWPARALMAPRKAMLQRANDKCKAEYMSEEIDYLKHVDIQKSPSLPKLRTSNPQGPQPEEGGNEQPQAVPAPVE